VFEKARFLDRGKVLPNWVDIANLIVLTITLGFIVWYVIATHRLVKTAQKQVQSLKKQSFENTFFQLLKFHNDIVSSYNILKKSYPTKIETLGRECFKEFYNNFRQSYGAEVRNTNKEDLSFIDSVYVKFYGQHQSDLPHYFRNLYSVINFVKTADISNKFFYTDLIRAQLSTHEQLILFYHCLSRYGKENLKPMVVEFQLLKEMPEDLLKESFHQQYYPQEAFGK